MAGPWVKVTRRGTYYYVDATNGDDGERTGRRQAAEGQAVGEKLWQLGQN